MSYPVIFIFLAIIVLIIVVLNLRASLLLEYVRKSRRNNLTFSISVLKGLIKRKIEIPLLEIGPEGIRVKRLKKMWKKEKVKEEEEESVPLTGFLSEIKTKYDTYRVIFNYFAEKVRADKLEIEIVQGTGDAFYTGTLMGYTWAVVGILDAFLTNRFKKIKIRISVQPNFEKKEFTVVFYCIFSAKIVHIIVVGLKYTFKKLKRKLWTGGGRIGSASNRGINGNCNGKH